MKAEKSAPSREPECIWRKCGVREASIDRSTLPSRREYIIAPSAMRKHDVKANATTAMD